MACKLWVSNVRTVARRRYEGFEAVTAPVCRRETSMTPKDELATSLLRAEHCIVATTNLMEFTASACKLLPEILSLASLGMFLVTAE